MNHESVEARWQVPDSWGWTTAGQVTDVVGGGTPRSSDSDNFDSGTIPWITPADLSGYKAKYICRGSRSLTERGLANSAARLLPKGSVLFSSRAPIGYVAIASIPLATNQGFKSLIPPPEIDPEFLYYYLQRAKGLAIGLASGTTFLEVSGAQMAKLPLVVAPLPEQHRIVEAVESYFTRLYDAVATLERVQRNLKRYRASVLKAAVEGRLVPTEAELARAEGRDYEPASMLLERILAERRRRWHEARGRGKYPEPVAPDTSGLPELPEGWCWASVDELTAGDRSSAYGVLVPGPDLADGVLLVRVGDINNGAVATGDLKRIARGIADRFARTYLRGGEVLITLVGTIGRTAVVPSSLAGANVARAVGVLPIAESVSARWVEAWFRSPRQRHRMDAKAHEVARKTLNLEDVRSAPVALPPQPEQLRICESIEDVDSVADNASLSLVHTNGRAQRLRQSILKWAFEGKLADQDPSDEPAALLLERIKVEREAAVAVNKNGRIGRKKQRIA